LTLPGIRIMVHEIDTHGVVRLRTGKLEYITVDKVCKAFGITPKELFARIRASQEGKPLFDVADESTGRGWLPVERIVKKYNRTAERAGLPIVRLPLGAGRRAKLRTRWKDADFRRSYKQVLTKIAASPFLCGQNDRGWRASFDWLIRNDDNWRKVLEGKYDERRTGETGPKTSNGRPVRDVLKELTEDDEA